MKNTIRTSTIGLLAALFGLGCPQAETESQCTAAPACGETEQQIEACTDDLKDCHAVSTCGQTIHCYTPEETCEAAPACDAGDTQVASESECPADTSCYQREMCGTTIWCWGQEPCTEGPPCKEDETKVATESDCLADGTCYSTELCGATVWCTAPGETCQGMPTCDGDDTMVAGPEGCLQDDAKCYEATLCGVTIWCTGPDDGCEAEPVCGTDHTQVEGPGGCLQDDAVCYEVTECGTTIWCTGPDSGGATAFLGAGNSFGECLGACKRELDVSGSNITLEISDWGAEAPLAVNQGSLTEAGQAAALATAAALLNVTLDETYGCPDCADGGASYVKLVRDGEQSTHTYEFMGAPEALKQADTFATALLQAAESCQSTVYFEPGEGCEPFTNE